MIRKLTLILHKNQVPPAQWMRWAGHVACMLANKHIQLVCRRTGRKKKLVGKSKLR